MEPAVDPTALSKAEEWGGRDLVEELIRLFLESTPGRVQAVQEAAAGREVAEGIRAAHSLRSSAQHLGARILSEIAKKAEESLNQGDMKDAAELGKRLDDEFQRVRQALGDASPTQDETEQGGKEMLPRIAVVEDNPDNRLLVQALIGDRYDISEYENGPQALDGIRAQPPGLVLLDISLPGMDGTEVLKELRSDPGLQDLPVVALTAHAMAGDREKYLAMGFDDYVTKPIVDEDVLIGAIERWLGR